MVNFNIISWQFLYPLNYNSTPEFIVLNGLVLLNKAHQHLDHDQQEQLSVCSFLPLVFAAL